MLVIIARLIGITWYHLINSFNIFIFKNITIFQGIFNLETKAGIAGKNTVTFPLSWLSHGVNQLHR